MSKEGLIRGLWGDEPPRTAPKTLQTYVSGLRRRLPEGALATTPGGYSLVVDPESVDSNRFETAVRSSWARRDAGDLRGAAGDLEAAMRLWRGEALVNAQDTAVLEAAARRLNELRRNALEDLGELALDMGRHSDVIPDLEVAVTAEPLRERRWAQLMTAYYRAGRQAEALRAYQRLRTILGEQLGIQPSQEISTLERDILAHNASLGPGGVTALSHPSERPQWLDDRRRFNNIPHQATSFIGREAQLAELTGLIGNARLVTLTGPGGVGKTRLALAIAATLFDGKGDGVWLVELAPGSDPDRVSVALADALGLREEPGRPTVERLVEFLRYKRTLIVLDNCEHLIEASAALVDEVLRSCEDVAVLATSRERLGIGGERVYRVPSLAVADAQASDAERLGCEAVQLFAERAALQGPSFRLDAANAGVVISICRKLDGIPLAIELAAARLRSLSLANIEALLEDRFRLLTGGNRTALARQQTLRALIDWSHDLLSKQEQIVLRRLSVFHGGFQLDTAEAVVGFDDVDTSKVMDLVLALVDKSLVDVRPNGYGLRYRLLDTVREYAAGHLQHAGGDETATLLAAHAQAFLRLAEDAAVQLEGSEVLAAIAQLDVETDNARNAFAHLSASDAGANDALRMAASLHLYWWLRGHYREGAEFLSAALRNPAVAGATIERCRALLGLARCQLGLGQHDDTESSVNEGLIIATALADRRLIAQALRHWALLQINLRYPDALATCNEALEAAEATQDHNLISNALAARGIAYDRAGQAELALADKLKAYVGYKAAGNTLEIPVALNNLANSELGLGELDHAEAHLHEARSRAEEIGRDVVVLYVLGTLAELCLLRDDPVAAEKLMVEALPFLLRSGDKRMEPVTVLLMATASSARGAATRAAYLHGAADKLCGTDAVGDALEEGLREKDHASLRARLGPDEFEVHYQQGHDVRSFDDLAKSLLAGRLGNPAR